MVRLLSVGLDPAELELVTLAVRLRWPDARVSVATDGQRGVELVEEETPDILLLQARADDAVSVTDVLRDVRRFSAVPIVVMEKDGAEADAVKVLEEGADDYVRLPCGPMELMSRMVALLRRTRYEREARSGSAIVSGALVVIPSTYEVFLGEKRLSLTPTEFPLLHILLKNRSVVVSHELLERLLWGERGYSASLLKKYIQRLRKKLGDEPREPRWIATVPGYGYRYVGPVPSSASERVAVAAAPS